MYCAGQAVIELQRVLPKARILYVSATGATDPEVGPYNLQMSLSAIPASVTSSC